MAEIHTIEERGLKKLHGRDRRSLNLSTKLTANEANAIEAAASRAGKTPSEWAREVLLRSDVVDRHTEMEKHIFTELVGIQMLLMGTLEPLLRGDKMVQDQITILFRQVQATKAAKAQELLEKRAKQRAEDALHATERHSQIARE
ncbi:MAG: hypothetical protein ABSD67_02835 [Terracidiphilus sp.]|jgi:hypothetical protein